MTLFICHVATRMTHVDESIYYAINYHDLCAGWLTGWRARASGALWSVALRSYDVAGEAEPYPSCSIRTSPLPSPHMIMYCRVLHTVRLPSSEWCTLSRTFSHNTCRIAARGSCSELRPWWPAEIPHRPATAHPHAPGAGPKLGRRTRPARSQAARHPKQRKPLQTSPVTNLVDHMRLK
jgi:hypothetical protein